MTAVDVAGLLAEIAETLRFHLTDRDEYAGCALRCGYDGDDRADHLAEALTPALLRLARAGEALRTGVLALAEELEREAEADVYAGIAGMTVSTDDGVIVLDLSTPEQPEHTRLRIGRQTALDLCDQIMDAVDVLDGGRWW